MLREFDTHMVNGQRETYILRFYRWNEKQGQGEILRGHTLLKATKDRSWREPLSRYNQEEKEERFVYVFVA